jgi:hypothetical protein
MYSYLDCNMTQGPLFICAAAAWSNIVFPFCRHSCNVHYSIPVFGFRRPFQEISNLDDLNLNVNSIYGLVLVERLVARPHIKASCSSSGHHIAYWTTNMGSRWDCQSKREVWYALAVSYFIILQDKLTCHDRRVFFFTVQAMLTQATASSVMFNGRDQ